MTVPHRPQLLISLAGVVALTLVVGLTVTLSGGASAGDSPAGSSTAGPLSPSAPGEQAADVVRAYFSAVSSRDAETALNLADTSLAAYERDLAEELLTAAGTDEVPTHIDVPPVIDDQATEVEASFTLGRRRSTVRVPVVRRDGRWRLHAPWRKWTIAWPQSDFGGLLINGVGVSSGEVYVLPGRYTFTLDHWAVTNAGTAAITVTDPRLASAPVLKAWVSPRGARAFRRVVAYELTRCLAKRGIAPHFAPKDGYYRGCPYGYRNEGPTRLRHLKTAQWRLRGASPIRLARVRVSTGSDLIAHVAFRMRLYALCRGPCLPGYPSAVTIDDTFHAEPQVAVDRDPEFLSW